MRSELQTLKDRQKSEEPKKERGKNPMMSNVIGKKVQKDI